MKPPPNTFTGPNAGEPFHFSIQTPLAARVGLFQRWTGVRAPHTMIFQRILSLHSMVCLMFGVVLTSGCTKQSTSDVEVKELTANMTEQQKASFQNILENADADTRTKVIQEMLRERKEALTIETILVRWRQDSAELAVPSDILSGSLLPSDIQALRELPLTGSLSVVQSGTDGSAGKRVRIIVVMQHQIDAPFKFAVPTSGTVFCVQLDSGWKLIPADYRTSNKTLELVRSDDKTTSLVKDDAGGVRVSTGFTWE